MGPENENAQLSHRVIDREQEVYGGVVLLLKSR